MRRILRTSDALADLDGIWSYIAERNISAADRLIDKLYARFQNLTDHPESGELQPLLADGSYRRIVEGRYVVYYRLDEDSITIIRVLHAARDEARLL
jgi:toxin ParE1/3/4